MSGHDRKRDWRGRAGGRISSWVVRPLVSLWLRRGSLAVFVVWLAVGMLPFVQSMGF